MVWREQLGIVFQQVQQGNIGFVPKSSRTSFAVPLFWWLLQEASRKSKHNSSYFFGGGGDPKEREREREREGGREGERALFFSLGGGDPKKSETHLWLHTQKRPRRDDPRVSPLPRLGSQTARRLQLLPAHLLQVQQPA